MSDIVPLTLIIAFFCEAALIAMLVWSIFVPDRRLWPPRQVSWLSQIIVWMPTIAVFGSAIIIGLIQWNALGWPLWLRWNIGLPLILAGNVVVWTAALGIGMDATSGAEAELKTEGFYRWSRNPQYVADMGKLLGWAILSAAPSAWIKSSWSGLVFGCLPPHSYDPQDSQKGHHSAWLHSDLHVQPMRNAGLRRLMVSNDWILTAMKTLAIDRCDDIRTDTAWFVGWSRS